MHRTVLNALANLIIQLNNLKTLHDPSPEHEARAKAKIQQITEDFLPHGSGFDVGTKVFHDESSADIIRMHTEFHHMDDNGFYDKWTTHHINIRPSFTEIATIIVNGVNYRDIKDHIHETFYTALSQEIIWDNEKERYIPYQNVPDDSTISVVWSVEDVISEDMRPDLTLEQAKEVLARVKHGHDAEIGINWEVIRDTANDIFPED